MLEVVSVPSWECLLGMSHPLQLTPHLTQVGAKRISYRADRYPASSLSLRSEKAEVEIWMSSEKSHSSSIFIAD